MSSSNAKLSLAEQRLYPHFKLTRENFARLLVTRKITDDDSEYFGAFLPETGVRFLIDFLNVTFRLRTCEIEIDGSFDVPCTQFYRKRCVAPCVENLCDEMKYAEQTELVRLFLRGDAAELEKRYLRKIELAAENFDYENAANLRDEWLSIEKIFAAKDWNFWLDDATDTYEIEETDENYVIYLVTMRGRKTLGKRAFVCSKTGERSEILPGVLPQIYQFYAPKEIRVSEDFADRFVIADDLSKRFSRKIKITVANENQPKVMTNRALGRTRYEHKFQQIRRVKTVAEIQTQLQTIFGLPEKPRRMEGFDVAHISASDFVAAKSVWENGKFLGKEYEFWFSDEESELETLRKFIEYRFSQNSMNFPDLILIDGGRSHLQAALKGRQRNESEINKRDSFIPHPSSLIPQIISAVKPPRQHGEIAYFLTATGAKIPFDGNSAAHRVLQILRDEAHDLSNEIHRQRREMAHFYELAAVLPSINESERREILKKFGSIKNLLEADENAFPTKIRSDLQNYKVGNAPKIEPVIVPLRYTDENGDAQDLRPLTTYRVK